MDHVGGQGQQISGKQKTKGGFYSEMTVTPVFFFGRLTWAGIHHEGRAGWAAFILPDGGFATGIFISLAFFTGDMIYQAMRQSVRGREETLISRGIGGHMVG